MVELGHITGATLHDLHRNCGKRCGKDPGSGPNNRMKPHVPAICTIMVRADFARSAQRNPFAPTGTAHYI
jgi:hypothetical protein